MEFNPRTATFTEAAGIACVYAILVARYIYRELSWHDIWQTAMDSGVLIRTPWIHLRGMNLKAKQPFFWMLMRIPSVVRCLQIITGILILYN